MSNKKSSAKKSAKKSSAKKSAKIDIPKITASSKSGTKKALDFIALIEEGKYSQPTIKRDIAILCFLDNLLLSSAKTKSAHSVYTVALASFNSAEDSKKKALASILAEAKKALVVILGAIVETENDIIAYIAKSANMSIEKTVALTQAKGTWAESHIHSALDALGAPFKGANQKHNSKGEACFSFGSMLFCLDKTLPRVSRNLGAYVVNAKYIPTARTSDELTSAIAFVREGKGSKK